MTPGLTQFAVMPCGPAKRAIDFVSATTPAFEAAYAAPAASPPVWPARDAIVTIRPLPLRDHHAQRGLAP